MYKKPFFSVHRYMERMKPLKLEREVDDAVTDRTTNLKGVSGTFGINKHTLSQGTSGKSLICPVAVPGKGRNFLNQKFNKETR